MFANGLLLVSVLGLMLLLGLGLGLYLVLWLRLGILLVFFVWYTLHSEVFRKPCF